MKKVIQAQLKLTWGWKENLSCKRQMMMPTVKNEVTRKLFCTFKQILQTNSAY